MFRENLVGGRTGSVSAKCLKIDYKQLSRSLPDTPNYLRIYNIISYNRFMSSNMLRSVYLFSDDPYAMHHLNEYTILYTGLISVEFNRVSP